MLAAIKDFANHNLISRFLKNLKIKQLEYLSLWQIGELYFKGLSKGLLSTRSAAISWNFFFSFFPFLLFLFSVLPFLPHYSEIEELFWTKIIPEYFPQQIGDTIDNAFSSIAKYQEESGKAVKWWPILLSVYLSSNAVLAFLVGFKNSYHYEKSKRGTIALRLIAIVLTIFFIIMMAAQLLISYYTKYIPLLEKEGSFDLAIIGNVTYNANYLTGFFIYFISVFVLFFVGYGKKKSFKVLFFSSFITALGFLLALFLFSIYMTTNKLETAYGVIGTFMVFMLLIYFNVVLILVGFELSAMLHSIKNGTATGDGLKSELKSFE